MKLVSHRLVQGAADEFSVLQIDIVSYRLHECVAD